MIGEIDFDGRWDKGARMVYNHVVRMMYCNRQTATKVVVDICESEYGGIDRIHDRVHERGLSTPSKKNLGESGGRHLRSVSCGQATTCNARISVVKD